MKSEASQALDDLFANAPILKAESVTSEEIAAELTRRERLG